ncbi:MAG TPA: 16S rRNA (guanine(527)-N(7))-methyltransferase RsmG [Ktedonobacteraceae bacterium]|jgi:16S rRNA (guanine527-N7)-methyltransferase|nr:16S rRNA (guanine(527)-N(7))-methyltransferase RsmG [Ktedonobacteraceae bacterium]
MSSADLFVQGLESLGLDVRDEHMTERFFGYRQALLDWNTRINLTAITDPQEVLVKHFLDSLSLLLVAKQERVSLLDIGSGAGFPGLPLKIARPDWHVTLLEATGKRINFLREVIEHLQLRDIVIEQGRAEEVVRGKLAYRAGFDLVTARAVSALPTLLEYSAPYCRVGGIIVAPKKGELSAELERGKRAAEQVGAVLHADVEVDIPGLQDGRRLLVWKQRKPCPAQFPRHGSTIAKRPLG